MLFRPTSTPRARLGRRKEDLARAEQALRFAGKLRAAREAERRRIALELHDGVGQSLALIGLELQNARHLLAPPPENEAVEVLRRLNKHLRAALKEIRHVTHDAGKSALAGRGLLLTLSTLLADLAQAAPRLIVERHFAVDEADIPVDLKSVIMRLTQEAIANTIHHAHAGRLRITLRLEDGRLFLAFEDDGQGFTPAAIAAAGQRGSGHGLAGMRERVLGSGGDFRIESAIAGGTRILASWPQAMTPPGPMKAP